MPPDLGKSPQLTLFVHILYVMCCVLRKLRKRPWRWNSPGSGRWTPSGSVWLRCSGGSRNRSSSVPLRRWSADRSSKRNVSGCSWSSPSQQYLPLTRPSYLASRPPRLCPPLHHRVRRTCLTALTTNSTALLQTLARPASTGHWSLVLCLAQGTTVS